MRNPEIPPSNPPLEPISLDEIDQLVDESNNAFLAPTSNPLQTAGTLLRIMKQDPKFTLHGYRVHGVPISYIIGLSHKDASTISLGPMFVAVQYQGRGLGKKQVQDFDNLAFRQGYTNVYTKTWLDNVAARKLFESLGFVESGIKYNDRANGDATISYILNMATT